MELRRRAHWLVAVGLVVSVLGARPVLAFAAATGARPCQMQEHGCGKPMLTSPCCCTDGNGLPDIVAPAVTRVHLVLPHTAPLLLAVASPASGMLPLLSRERRAPTHGFLSVDLPTLHSTFLI